MKEFISAIDQICEEKGISKEKVIETVEMAIAAAYKKDHGLKGFNIRSIFNEKIGGFNIFQAKMVVTPDMVLTEQELEELSQKQGEEDMLERETGEIIENGERKIRFSEDKHIYLEDVRALDLGKKKEGVRRLEEKEEKFNIFIVGKKTKGTKTSKKNIQVGDEIWFKLEPKEDYGRIAAQTAKQVVIQRIREAEREAVFDEFKNKEGQVIPAVVQRIERGLVFMDIGKTSGVLFPEDQIPGEYYRLGQRLRVYVVEVRKETKGPAIIVSRTHPEMIKKLFELEVPEIVAGDVEIKSVAREAGSRSKIAVASKGNDIDPIGACVGQRGTRVQAVINELGGEKIDIIEWSKDATKFIAQALSPAKVIAVEIDEEKKIAQVQVPEDQLSLAIGKQGQNVRLAAKLTGWKIDILTEEGEKVGVEEAEKKEKTTDEEKEETKSKKSTKAKKTKTEKTVKKEKATKKKNSEKTETAPDSEPVD